MLARQPSHAPTQEALAVLLQKQGISTGDCGIPLCSAGSTEQCRSPEQSWGGLVEQGQVDDALAAFRAAASLQPNDPVAYYNLGEAFIARNQRGEAIQSLPSLHRVG